MFEQYFRDKTNRSSIIPPLVSIPSLSILPSKALLVTAPEFRPHCHHYISPGFLHQPPNGPHADLPLTSFFLFFQFSPTNLSVYLLDIIMSLSYLKPFNEGPVSLRQKMNCFPGPYLIKPNCSILLVISLSHIKLPSLYTN